MLTQAAQSQVGTAEVTVGRRVQAAATSRSGVESLLTQAPPNVRSADMSRRRRVKALQRRDTA